MLALSAHTKVYLARQPTDLRKSFRGLIAMTEALLRQQPDSGHLFVFVNRRRDLLKILYWDGTGFCIWAKRLERGSFQTPGGTGVDASGQELSVVQLSLMLQGIDLTTARQRLRFQRVTAAVPAAS